MWRFTGMVHVWCVEIPCDECWCMNVDAWMNDECWCMNVDEWMMNVDEWMNDCWWMNDECWWMKGEWMMNADGWMMNEYECWCMLMNVRCMLNDVWCIYDVWCIDVCWIGECVSNVCISFVIIIIYCIGFVIVLMYWFYYLCLFVFQGSYILYVSCTCNKTVTPYDGVCLRPHTHEPVTYMFMPFFIEGSLAQSWIETTTVRDQRGLPCGLQCFRYNRAKCNPVNEFIVCEWQ